MKHSIVEFKDEYKFLSNFWPVNNKIKYDDIAFSTVENAYQAAKCINKEDIKKFQFITPGQAKRLGNKIEIRPDWKQVKYDVMEELVRQKFTKNSSLKEALLQTNDFELIEGNNWHDNIWGSCTCNKCNNKGNNRLGLILMKIRNELK